MNSEISNEIQEMIAKVAEEVHPYVDESCELTAVTLAKRLGMAPQTARKKLMEMEKDGELERVLRRTRGGNRVDAWRKK